MLTPDPVRTAARQKRRSDQIGKDATCVRCGANDPVVLDRVQGHHVANRVNDPSLTVILCSNCHRQATEMNETAGIPTRYPEEPTPLDQLAAILAGIALFLRDLAERLGEWATWASDLQRKLNESGIDVDKLLPNWTPQAPWNAG